MVGFERHAIGSLADRYGGASRKNFGKQAVVIRIEMLNEYDGEAGIARQIAQQALKNLKPARGGAYAHYRNRSADRLWAFLGQAGRSGVRQDTFRHSLLVHKDLRLFKLRRNI
jgi:hypothetical protein